MLIPQARIGRAERRRVDFVLFVPLQYYRYKWYAIQLDAAHPSTATENDKLRDEEIRVHGYETLNLRPEGRNYYPEVTNLVEQVDREMRMAESESGRREAALEVPVIRTEDPYEDEAPF
jgi:hypothetical protein